MTRTHVGRLLGSALLIAALAGCGSDYNTNSPGGTNAPAQAPGATTAAASDGNPGGGYP